jgi:hypothetical protein
MTAPVIVTLANPSERKRRRGQRAEDREQNEQHDREADLLSALEVLLREVLHARPERLLAHEVRLHAAAHLGPELVMEVHRHVGGLVLVAVHLERDDRDRGGLGAALRGRRGALAQRHVGKLVGDAAHAVDLRRHRGGVGARLAGKHDGEVLALSALEALDVGFHDLRLRAGHLEPAAREVLGLTRCEREGREDHHHPGGEDKPPAPLEKSRQPVHRGLHAWFATRAGALRM